MLTTVGAASFEIGSWVLLAGPVAGIAMYWMIFQFYRNTNKSHRFEHETLIDAQPPIGDDVKIRSMSKTKQSNTSGSNGAQHRRRVQRLS